MKFILTLYLIICSCMGFGQTKYPGKQEVEKVIKLTISQKMTDKNPACEYGQCGEWWAPNKDNLFYKSDTVKFYNSSNIVYSDTSFCTSLVWDFGNGNTFNDSHSDMCKEPPTRSVKILGKEGLPNKFRIISKDGTTYIVIYAEANQASSLFYQVIDLEKTKQQNLGDNSYCLTLVRQQQE